MNLEVPIIVVTYNAIPWIDKCLNSCKPHPIIIVDNASSDDTIKYVETNFKEVILIKQSTNLGFGQANNIGIKKALDLGYESVFLLNQDAYLIGNCINDLVNLSIENKDIGILSPIHLNGNGDDYDEQFFMYANNISKILPDRPNLKVNKRNFLEVNFINAAGWLITKKCLKSVGGFDPLFFHYGEDNNYCQRVLYSGLKIGVVYGVHIAHDRESRSKKEIITGSDYYFERLERRLKSKYGNINVDGLVELKKLKLKRLKESIKALLKLNFKVCWIKLKEVLLIRKLYPKIARSRMKNSNSSLSFRYL